MKKSPIQKSKKSVRKRVLSEETKKTIPVIKKSILIFFGMILGVVIIGAIAEIKMESVDKKFPGSIALNTAQKSSAKYPATAKVGFPIAILNVNGSVKSVSKDEIEIKTSVCQGEKKYTGKITARTEIIKRERQNNPPSIEEIDAKLSDIKKDDQVTLESLEDISKEPVFEVKRVIIEKLIAAPDAGIRIE